VTRALCMALAVSEAAAGQGAAELARWSQG
jgi:hypothetical protein